MRLSVTSVGIVSEEGVCSVGMDREGGGVAYNVYCKFSFFFKVSVVFVYIYVVKLCLQISNVV